MTFLFVFLVIAVMIALNFTKIKILGWLLAWWIASYLILSFGINPPLPSSIIGMFMAIVTLALVTYLSANSEEMEIAKKSIIRFLVDKKFSKPLTVVIILLPILAGTKAYFYISKPIVPPLSNRTIHPPPPPEIQFKGKNIDIVRAVNPYRELEGPNPKGFEEHVQNGRKIYYQNCVHCHGDNLQGKGMFAHGFNPIPANFTDPTTIAMLQESYLFWRIAKGASGLPEESTPWDSAMPAWEKFLTEEEIWDVILFLYDFTDQKPRAQEEIE